jgi:hypothetical protein
MEQFIYLENNTTLMTVSDPLPPYTEKVLPLLYGPISNFSTNGRAFFLKEVSGIPNVSQFRVLTSEAGILIPPSTTTLTVSSLQCMTFFESPYVNFNLMNVYRGTSVFSTLEMAPPTSLAVPVSGKNSSLFVDLTYQSKALVLPSLDSLTLNHIQSPYFLIKDAYGNANTKPLFLSSTAGATIDGLGASIAIRDKFASIEIAGDLSANRWHILNYYSGNFPEATIGPLIESQYSVSSSIVNVNVSSVSALEGTSKVLYLPPASTVLGMSYTIRDTTGSCSPISSIYISTTGLDKIDVSNTLVQLSTSLQSFRVMAHNSTNYAILQNYTFGFEY